MSGSASVGAVQKEELQDTIKAITERHDNRIDEDQQRFADIFSRLDAVAQSAARIEGYLQAQRDHQK